MKIRNYFLLTSALVLGFISCNKDDNDSSSSVEARDRTEQYATDLDSIETYLETHFYNYEEFANNPNAKIVFDTIDGVNADKIPLINQVDYKMVFDQNEEENLEYKLYYLKVREGGGSQPTFGDRVTLNYKGNTIYGDVFDSKVTPIPLSLPSTVQGFREVMVEFRSATSVDIDNSGNQNFTDYGIGAMFIPSGLGYYENYITGIPTYSPLIYTIELMSNTKFTDDDGDGIYNILEDLDGNRDLANDDTDEDFIQNFIDSDDDGDGTPTSEEIITEIVTATTQSEIENLPLESNQFLGEIIEVNGGFESILTTLPDENGNGIPNYLDEDEDQSFDNN